MSNNLCFASIIGMYWSACAETHSCTCHSGVQFYTSSWWGSIPLAEQKFGAHGIVFWDILAHI